MGKVLNPYTGKRILTTGITYKRLVKRLLAEGKDPDVVLIYVSNDQNVSGFDTEPEPDVELEPDVEPASDVRLESEPDIEHESKPVRNVKTSEPTIIDLYRAVRKGDEKSVAKLITHVHPSERDSIMVHVAAGTGNVAVLKMLIDAGGDPKAVHCSALKNALDRQEFEAARFLIETGGCDLQEVIDNFSSVTAGNFIFLPQGIAFSKREAAKLLDA
jgi:hypothetical protein